MKDRPNTAAERTSLSWRRTALAVLGGAFALWRLTLDDLGPVAIIVVMLAVPLSLWVVAESARRRGGRSDGRAAAVLTLAVVLLAIVELVALSRSW